MSTVKKTGENKLTAFWVLWQDSTSDIFGGGRFRTFFNTTIQKAMKLVGFIREYNDLSESKKLSELLESKSLNTIDIGNIINYLDQGVLLFGWMGYFIDFETKKLIAPDSYFTDGIWVWPSYLSYYLKKYPMLMVDEEFVKHIEKKGFQFSVEENFNTQKDYLEEELTTKLSE